MASWKIQAVLKASNTAAIIFRPLAALPATSIACTMGGHWLSEDVKAMQKEPNWTFRTIQTGHFPMVSTPKRVVELLDEAAAR